jgi:hypothetical protein
MDWFMGFLPSSGRGARFEVSVERKRLLVGGTSPRFGRSASGIVDNYAPPDC